MLTAALGEWQFSVFLREDIANFLGSLAFNALYLTGAYLLVQPTLNLLRERPSLVLIHAVFFGVSGLMVEWFLIGNSPWGNPDASQIGMFAYWACIVLVPLAVLSQQQAARRFVIQYGLGYAVLIVLGQALIPNPEWRFGFHIYAVVLGYLGLMVGILWCFLKVRA